MRIREEAARKDAGFSLLEILMAILLLGISFVGLTAYSGSQRKALGKSGDQTEAANIAVTIMEKTKIPLADSTAFANEYKLLTAPQTASRTYKGRKITYTVITILSRISGSDNMINAKVMLSWPTGHSYNLGMVLVQP